jgi:hypothetical protein
MEAKKKENFLRNLVRVKVQKKVTFKICKQHGRKEDEDYHRWQ